MTVCDSLIATLGEDIWRSMMISDASSAECQLDSEPVNVETDIVVVLSTGTQCCLPDALLKKKLLVKTVHWRA